jgi:hypothetical protein
VREGALVVTASNAAGTTGVRRATPSGHGVSSQAATARAENRGAQPTTSRLPCGGHGPRLLGPREKTVAQKPEPVRVAQGTLDGALERVPVRHRHFHSV